MRHVTVHPKEKMIVIVTFLLVEELCVEKVVTNVLNEEVGVLLGVGLRVF